MLFRFDAPEWYQNHNYHRTDTWGGSLNGWYRWRGGKTALGIEYRSEMILSTVLGEALQRPIAVPHEDADYLFGKTRGTSSLFLEHSGVINRFSVNGGAMVTHISGAGWNLFPGVDVSYQLTAAVDLVASWNTSLRMPTFTDLYYASPTNIGNPDLFPEESVSIDGGFKMNRHGINGSLILFHQKGTHLIDWVRDQEETVWRSMNHTSVKGSGLEMNLVWYPRMLYRGHWPDKLEIGFFYHELNKSDGALISYYILDYLRSKIVFSANHTLYKGLMVDLKLTGQKRMGSYTFFNEGVAVEERAYEPIWLVDAKLIYPIRNFTLNLSVNNLLNQNYFDLGNIVQPGRWVKAGLSYQLKNR